MEMLAHVCSFSSVSPSNCSHVPPLPTGYALAVSMSLYPLALNVEVNLDNDSIDVIFARGDFLEPTEAVPRMTRIGGLHVT